MTGHTHIRPSVVNWGETSSLNQLLCRSWRGEITQRRRGLLSIVTEVCVSALICFAFVTSGSSGNQEVKYLNSSGTLCVLVAPGEEGGGLATHHRALPWIPPTRLTPRCCRGSGSLQLSLTDEVKQRRRGRFQVPIPPGPLSLHSRSAALGQLQSGAAGNNPSPRCCSL